jgi:hypothetical protein
VQAAIITRPPLVVQFPLTERAKIVVRRVKAIIARRWALAPRHERHRNLLGRRTAASQFFFRDPAPGLPSRRELTTTLTDDSAIAAAAIGR